MKRITIPIAALCLSLSIVQPRFWIENVQAEVVPPALFYTFVSLNQSKADCLKRAFGALTTGVKGGQIMRRDNDVSFGSIVNTPCIF